MRFNLFCLGKHTIQKLLFFKGVFLSVLLVSVSVIEASHAEEDDCDELSCLICHANADTEQTKLSQSFEIINMVCSVTHWDVKALCLSSQALIN